MYVIRRRQQDGGGFVSRSGVPGSYTEHNVFEIRVFATRREAEANRCVGNERVLPLAPILGLDALCDATIKGEEATCRPGSASTSC